MSLCGSKIEGISLKAGKCDSLINKIYQDTIQ